MYHNFFIHLSVDGHLGCFHVRAIVNSAAVNSGYTRLSELCFSQGIRPILGLLGHVVVFGFPSGSGDKEPACQCRRYERQVGPVGREGPLEGAWQPTAVFPPGKPHGQRSLVGYSPRGCKEPDMTEVTQHACGSFLRALCTISHSGEAALEALGLPRGGRVWRQHRCVDYGAWAARHAGELVASGTGMRSLGVFSSPWQLCPVGSSAGVARPLASQEPWPPRARERGTVRVLSLGPASWRAEGLGAALYLSAAALSPTPGWAPQARADPSGASAARLPPGLGRGGCGHAPPSARDSACGLAPKLPGSAPQTFPLTCPSGRLSLRPQSAADLTPGLRSSSPPPRLPGRVALSWVHRAEARTARAVLGPLGVRGPAAQASGLTPRLSSDVAVGAQLFRTADTPRPHSSSTCWSQAWAPTP